MIFIIALSSFSVACGQKEKIIYVANEFTLCPEPNKPSLPLIKSLEDFYSLEAREKMLRDFIFGQSATIDCYKKQVSK